MNLEMLSIKNEFEPGKYDSGNVMTAELKFRVFRENYILANYATANMTDKLKEGSTVETGFGVKSFIYSGLELHALMANKVVDDTTAETSINSTQIQVHYAF